MRLRDLDNGQSIIIWGKSDITHSIAHLNSVNVEDLNSVYVLNWVTYNTII